MIMITFTSAAADVFEALVSTVGQWELVQRG